MHVYIFVLAWPLGKQACKHDSGETACDIHTIQVCTCEGITHYNNTVKTCLAQPDIPYGDLVSPLNGWKSNVGHGKHFNAI